MRINADFEKQVVIRPQDYQWVPSPMPGVERMMLDRVGEEVARATSLVRYEPHSQFSPHTHGGGEEYFVLEGVFADEHGDYPAGTYARNPIGSSHTPRIGPEGAIIFVKLRQFELADTAHFTLNTQTASWEVSDNPRVQTIPLHHFEAEVVRLIKLAPQSQLPKLDSPKAREIFILEGCLSEGTDTFPKGSWMRTPSHQPLNLYTKDSEAVIFEKVGLLPKT